MQLKVKFLKLTAGRPVAILNKKFANRNSIHVDDRVVIYYKSKQAIAVVDLVVGMIGEDEIAVSTEVSQLLELREHSLVRIRQALQPSSIPIIMEKMNCKVLNQKEILLIIKDIVKNALTEAEIAYFVSSVYKCGMSTHEVRDMTNAIVNTGLRLNLKGKVADKHSIGGIPGRTTPIVVPICASAGLIMPKTSSRAITSPAGTADALEVICKVDFSVPEIKKIIKKTGACMVWGGALGLAPADDKIIQVERLLNLDPEAQLLASIMAKKLAAGSKYILIEIPYGKSAKFTKPQALKLKRKFESLGKSFNVKLRCILLETLEPLGNGIGPALEIKDVIKVLKRESSCFHLEKRALTIAGNLLELTGKAKPGKGLAMAGAILDSGQAFKKFQEIIRAQRGKLSSIPEAKYHHTILAGRNGKVREINSKKINSLSHILGCPADKSSGIYLYKHLSDSVKKGEKILTLYSETMQELNEGIKFYSQEIPIIIK